MSREKPQFVPPPLISPARMAEFERQGAEQKAAEVIASERSSGARDRFTIRTSTPSLQSKPAKLLAFRGFGLYTPFRRTDIRTLG